MKTKTYRIARSCFSAWEREDGTNELWEKIAKQYPPKRGSDVSTVPARFTVGTTTIDCESGSIFCLKPLPPKTETFILYKR